MPQGKGTYGKQVGRPPKKGNKKYEGAGSVSMNTDPFSTRNPEGVPSEQFKEVVDNKNKVSEGIPTTNAMDRSQTSPDIEQYKKGGKVDVTDVVKDVETLEALEWGYKQLPKEPKGQLMSAKNIFGRRIVDTKAGIERKRKRY